MSSSLPHLIGLYAYVIAKYLGGGSYVVTKFFWGVLGRKGKVLGKFLARKKGVPKIFTCDKAAFFGFGTIENR